MAGEVMTYYVDEYTDVELMAHAGAWVAETATKKAKRGWSLVSFCVCQHTSGDGTPLRGAAVFAVFRREA